MESSGAQLDSMMMSILTRFDRAVESHFGGFLIGFFESHWAGTFPTDNSAVDGFAGAAPTDAFGHLISMEPMSFDQPFMSVDARSRRSL